MGATGGTVLNISLGGREFTPAADAEASMKLGGFEVAQEPNGDSSARKLKTRVAWAVTGLSLQIDHTIQDQEYLQANADSNGNEDFTVSYADGTIYQGEGSVTGELSSASASATGPVEFGGPGKLTQQ